jgi:hypothetical protein
LLLSSQPSLALGKALDRVGGDITAQQSDIKAAIIAAEGTAARMDRPW